MMKHVLIILVTYNGRQWLHKCLRSLNLSGGRFATNASPGIWTDLIVIDNHSSDGSAEIVAEICPQAKLVRSRENLGFTGGNNLGFQHALRRKYDYVYLINQDAWLEKDTLEKLVACAEANPEYAVLSPLQMTPGLEDFDPRFKRIARGSAFRRGQRPVPVRFVMAAHWLMRLEALRDVGFFSELFPHYGQDDNWCDRARSRGWKIGIFPPARAVHDRADRKESQQQRIDRVFRTTALVRLADPNHPLWSRVCYVRLYALVKSLKFRSLEPLRMLPDVLARLPEIKKYLSLHAALPPREKAK